MAEQKDKISALAAKFENLDTNGLATRKRGPSAMRPPPPGFGQVLPHSFVSTQDGGRRHTVAPGRPPPRDTGPARAAGGARPPPRPVFVKSKTTPAGVTIPVSDTSNATLSPSPSPQPSTPNHDDGNDSGGNQPSHGNIRTLQNGTSSSSGGGTTTLTDPALMADSRVRIFGEIRDISVSELENAPLYPLIQQMERGTATLSEFVKALQSYSRSQIKMSKDFQKSFEKSKKQYAEMEGMANFTFVLEMVHQLLHQTCSLHENFAQYIQDICMPLIENVMKQSASEQHRITKGYKREEKTYREAVNSVKKAQSETNQNAEKFRAQMEGNAKKSKLTSVFKKKLAPGEMNKDEQILYEKADESARKYKDAIGDANRQRQTFVQEFSRAKQDIVNMETTRIQSVLQVMKKIVEKYDNLQKSNILQQLSEDIISKIDHTHPDQEVSRFVQETVARGTWQEPDEFKFDVNVEYRDTWRSIEDAIEVTRENDPNAKVPKIVTRLCEKIMELGGEKAEGIFRVSPNKHVLNTTRKQLRDGNFAMEDDNPHLYATLIKEWLRTLHEPLIPSLYYDVCVSMARDGSLSKDQFDVFFSQMPEVNRETLKYLARFLKKLSASEKETKMGMDNFALLFAPCFLRCTSDDPRVIMENSDAEKQFVVALMNVVIQESTAK